MENIRLQNYRMRLQTFYSKEQVEATIKEHRQILNAIKEKNPEKVEQTIRKHYQDAKERLIKKENIKDVPLSFTIVILHIQLLFQHVLLWYRTALYQYHFGSLISQFLCIQELPLQPLDWPSSQ